MGRRFGGRDSVHSGAERVDEVVEEGSLKMLRAERSKRRSRLWRCVASVVAAVRRERRGTRRRASGKVVCEEAESWREVGMSREGCVVFVVCGGVVLDEEES